MQSKRIRDKPEFATISPLGDCGVIVQLGETIDLPTHQRVQAVFQAIEARCFPWLVECAPGFTQTSLFG